MIQRVNVKPVTENGMYAEGMMLGMHVDERGDMMCVIRLDGMGILLDLIHPSRVYADD